MGGGGGGCCVVVGGVVGGGGVVAEPSPAEEPNHQAPKMTATFADGGEKRAGKHYRGTTEIRSVGG
jgi:hypothetical protein